MWTGRFSVGEVRVGPARAMPFAPFASQGLQLLRHTALYTGQKVWDSSGAEAQLLW
jgi:hypothetical protein